MATNPFDAAVNVNNNINRSNHDWRHANNFSTKIGQITPVFSEVVPPASSLKVDPKYLLKMMPMGFPIQTQMKARLSFFKIPLRILWKDYMDYIGNFRNDLVEPYHDVNTNQLFDEMFKTGKIMDYFGVPTTIFGEFGVQRSVSYQGILGSLPDSDYAETPHTFAQLSRNRGRSAPMSVSNWNATRARSIYADPPADVESLPYDSYTAPYFDYTEYHPDYALPSFSSCRVVFPVPSELTVPNTSGLKITIVSDEPPILRLFERIFNEGTTSKGLMINTYHEDGSVNASTDILSTSNSLVRIEDGWEITFPNGLGNSSPVRAISFTFDPYYLENVSESSALLNNQGELYFSVQITYPADVLPEDIDRSTSPWFDSNNANSDNQIKISAYMARAYECVYNAYYRDNRNNPYVLDGQEQYNKFLPTLDGGSDTNIYSLRFANYEKDFLTTAVRSPQQGVAPLVGITTYTRTESLGKNADGIEEFQTTSKLAIVDEDGQAFDIAFKNDDEGLTDVAYTPLSNVSGLSQARSLIDLASSGISIADLRNVNAYQKFLELNMRKGYMYRDIIQGRWNVTVRYNDLLMPEFIGGSTREIHVSPVTQSVMRSDSGLYEDALGSQSGNGSVYGDAESITVYCDEESIVLGLLTIVPIPIYTQLLPKHFTYRTLLDHFQPEFAHIGYQPITYREVCPIQAYNSDPVNGLSKTFGYQRAWYEYVQKYDTAHGEFRKNLRNFLMHREFNSAPELSEEFLLINPDEVNNVFSVTEETDKIFGQIYFECSAKLPVPKIIIPRLD